MVIEMMQDDGKGTDMQVTDAVQQEFEAIIASAYNLSADIGEEVEQVLRLGREQPLDHHEATRLLTKAVIILRKAATQRGDEVALRSLTGDVDSIVSEVVAARERLSRDANGANAPIQLLDLVSRNGIPVRAVKPSPVFDGKEVPMRSGFVKLTDLALWDENERLDIHIAQFHGKHGRKPNREELLDIMSGRLPMPGIRNLPGLSARERTDQFEIVQLARSIAVNGVQRPPILDVDGTVLDGNRRITACYFIQNSDEFDSNQKRQVEYVFVYQLTEHATDDQRNAVVVTLNFEPANKMEWPEYVKAQKVFDEWQAMLMAEPDEPNAARQRAMKKQLSAKFALGPELRVVTRYIDMVKWALEFEEHHVDRNGRDEYEVKHRASHYFQYFDELNKGKASGPASALSQDEGYKHVVFDLLFDGKFKNFAQLRELRNIANNEDARAALVKARQETDLDAARDHVENAIAIVKIASVERRTLGANTRIETFVEWLEQLPPRAFREDISPANLRRLHGVLELVSGMVDSVLATKGDDV